jgi:hypothetical protein
MDGFESAFLIKSKKSNGEKKIEMGHKNVVQIFPCHLFKNTIFFLKNHEKLPWKQCSENQKKKITWLYPGLNRGPLRC